MKKILMIFCIFSLSSLYHFEQTAAAESKTNAMLNKAQKILKGHGRANIKLDGKLGSFTNSGQKAMDLWVTKALLAQKEPFCWKGNIGLGKTFARNVCKSGYQFWGGRCFGPCPSGYKPVKNLCHIKGCPRGWKWDKVFKNCFHGPLFKRKVKKGRLPRKSVAAGCPAGHKTTLTSCLPQCPAGYQRNILNICEQKCPSSRPVICGAGCAKTKANCRLAVAGMVAEPLFFAVDTALTIVSAGGAKAATLALKKAVKKVWQQSMKKLLQKGYKAAIKKLAAEIAKGIGKHVATTLATNFGKRVATELVKKSAHSYASSMALAELETLGAASTWINFAIGLEPTGIADIIMAFKYPTCTLKEMPKLPSGICSKPRRAKMQKVHNGLLKCFYDGFFDLIQGGTCWVCPPGAKRTLAAVNAHNACVIPRHDVFRVHTAKDRAYYRDKKGRKRGTFIASKRKCPRGQSKVMWGNMGGYCITCPSGYKPNNPKANRWTPKNNNGCVKSVPPKHHRAKLISKPGYKCPDGYARDFTKKWNASDACERLVTCK